MHVARLRGVLAAALAAAGCDQGARPNPPPPAPVPKPPPKPFTCETWAENLREALDADYVERRRILTMGNPEVAAEGRAGEPCKTAKDSQACSAALAADPCNGDVIECGLWRHRGGESYPSASVLYVTRGDAVLEAHDLASLKTLLGPIDAPAKAFVILSTQKKITLECKPESIVLGANTFTVIAQQEINDCPLTYARLTLEIARDGSMKELAREVLPDTGVCVGRRPAGLRPTVRGQASPVGRYFAAIAHLEAASVTAFERLRAELQAHRAPTSLQRAALRARADEVRHAAMMTTLAHRWGASVEDVKVRRVPPRSLRAVAIENAREGCVRETWGALEAAHQARFAGDPAVRRAYRTIAADEARHASLSWQVASWAEQTLSRRDVRSVRAARDRAVRELAGEVSSRRSDDLVRIAGVPAASTAARLFASLAASVWSAK